MDPHERIAGYAEVARKGSEAFWQRVKKWFLVTAVLGAVVGLGVTVLHAIVFGLLWERFLPLLNPVTVVLFPVAGLGLSGLILQRFTADPGVHGTEEVIEAYHEREGRFRLRSFPGKVAAAVATVGFGGSAGLEGPSIYIGGSLGSLLLRRAKSLLGFTDEDVRTLMVAGSAAGISAIFKAPLTGIVFALEVPYMDDLARESLIPSLIASVSSYLVLVQFLGVRPLFLVEQRYSLSPTDLPYSMLVGVLVGLVARAFIMSFRAAERLGHASGLPLWARTSLGGLVTGLLGLASLLLLGGPFVLGTGYEAIEGLVSGSFAPAAALALLLLKTGATISTLGSGAAGGVFIPMIMLGAASGAVIGGLLPAERGALFPVVGMAAFLAAGYNTPLAAAVFIAESTGGAGYLIPGLVGAAVAYTVAGRLSVSEKQRWRRETRLDALMRTLVGDIMTRDVVAVPPETTLAAFLSDYVVKLRHKSFPVAEGGRLVGMVALSDVREVPRASWDESSVGELAVRDVVTISPREAVGHAIERMAAGDFDRLPVVDPARPDRLVGIVSYTDVLALDAMREEWRKHRGRRPPLA
ncbi:MAG: chloride channel protein [Coriobacteriia bacterium]|nr:chloride channel protein [Coriobacteriia bacterium]